MVGRKIRNAAAMVAIISRFTTNEPITASGVRERSGPPSASVVSTAHARRSSMRITNAPAVRSCTASVVPARSRSSRSVTRLVPILRVRLDDVPHQSVAHDVDVREVVEGDSLDAREDALDLHQAGLLALREIDLGLVAGDDDLRVHAEPGEEHLHLHR